MFVGQAFGAFQFHRHRILDKQIGKGFSHRQHATETEFSEQSALAHRLQESGAKHPFAERIQFRAIGVHHVHPRPILFFGKTPQSDSSPRGKPVFLGESPELDLSRRVQLVLDGRTQRQ